MVDQAVWQSVSEILTEPERIAGLAREQLRIRGLADSEAEIEGRLRQIDRKVLKEREAMDRLIHFHAESKTLNEEDFERAATSMRLKLEQLEEDRESLLRLLPGAKVAETSRQSLPSPQRFFRDSRRFRLRRSRELSLFSMSESA